MTLLQRLSGWIRARLLGSMPAFNHWLPPDNSNEQWAVGVDTCFYCLTHKQSPSWAYRCPRRRPPAVEMEA